MLNDREERENQVSVCFVLFVCSKHYLPIQCFCFCFCVFVCFEAVFIEPLIAHIHLSSVCFCFCSCAPRTTFFIRCFFYIYFIVCIRRCAPRTTLFIRCFFFCFSCVCFWVNLVFTQAYKDQQLRVAQRAYLESQWGGVMQRIKPYPITKPARKLPHMADNFYRFGRMFEQYIIDEYNRVERLEQSRQATKRHFNSRQVRALSNGEVEAFSTVASSGGWCFDESEHIDTSLSMF